MTSQDITTAARGPNPLDKTSSPVNPTYSATNSQLNSQALGNPNNTSGFNVDVQPIAHQNNKDDEFMDYYRVLGLAPTATQYDVDLAYKKQASTNYPKTDTENRTATQKKFNEASQAYATLSDPARRDHYDQLHTKKYSKNDALKTFDDFFKDFDIEENEQQFFKKYYPTTTQNSYYQILGVKKNASHQEIADAFRNLSVQYHPKNQQTNKESEKRFTEICDAYNHLHDDYKRRHYDRIISGQQVPTEAAYQQFNDKFEGHTFQDKKDEETIGKVVKKASLKKEIQKANRPSQVGQTRIPSNQNYNSQKRGDNRTNTQASHTTTGSHISHGSNMSKPTTTSHSTAYPIHTTNIPYTTNTTAQGQNMSSVHNPNPNPPSSAQNTKTVTINPSKETHPQTTTQDSLFKDAQIVKDTNHHRQNINNQDDRYNDSHRHKEDSNSYHNKQEKHYNYDHNAYESTTNKRENYSDFLKMNHDYTPNQQEYGYKPYEWVSSTYNTQLPQESENYNNHYAEDITHETVTVNGPNGPVTKRITHKNSLVNGKEKREKYEEVLNADGSSELTETIRDSNGESTNKYNVKDGVRTPVAIKQ